MAPPVRVPALIPGRAFLHVIYDYRYLALATWAWNTYGPDGTDADQARINLLAPGFGVMAQDSLLVHVRALVDFYAKGGGDETDVLIGDFGFRPPAAWRVAKLKRYKASIELHALHITAYRDPAHRWSVPATPRRQSSRRINWNKQNPRMATELFETLRLTARQARPWREPFQLLHEAASALSVDSADKWPPELTEASDVRRYLKGLGIPT